MPTPPFFEKLLAAGPVMLPDSAHTAAVPFIDVAAFNSEPSPRVIFHTLVHVTQMVVIGPEQVMEGCFQALTVSGLWMMVPFEEQATKWMPGSQRTLRTSSQWKRKSANGFEVAAIELASHASPDRSDYRAGSLRAPDHAPPSGCAIQYRHVSPQAGTLQGNKVLFS